MLTIPYPGALKGGSGPCAVGVVVGGSLFPPHARSTLIVGLSLDQKWYWGFPASMVLGGGVWFSICPNSLLALIGDS